MEAEYVRKHAGKKVLIILRNNFQYTGIIPEFEGNTFSIIDKFGSEINISCDFIVYLQIRSQK